MRARYLIVMTLIAFLPIFLGCAGTPELDKNWGRSLEAAQSNQIANLEAQKNLDPVVGLGGGAAEMILEAYMGSFAPAEGEASYSINLGSTGGIGRQSGEVPYTK